MIVETLKDGVRSALGAARNLLDAPVLVLLYHRVTTLESDPQQLAVRPENFRRHMEWLKLRYPILRFEEDWRAARRPAVVVTFDDGYADNAREALPIAAAAGVPVTFFISTGNLDSRREFWWDELERCVQSPALEASPVEIPVQAGMRRFATADRGSLYASLHALLKGMTGAVRDRALSALRAQAGLGETGRESHRALSLDEVRTMAASRWASLGAHSASHGALAALSEDEQRKEIETSRKLLEGVIGRRVDLFSYPFGGRRDYDRRTVALCRAARFRKAASNVQGSWHRWQDELQIPRRLVRDWTLPEFTARIGRFFRQ